MIKEKELMIRQRQDPVKRTKYTKSECVTVNEKKKEYDYYICDYCGQEIKIENDISKQDGGTLEFRNMKLALHNRCLNKFLKEYN